jgi:hypothetical protein
MISYTANNVHYLLTKLLCLWLGKNNVISCLSRKNQNDPMALLHLLIGFKNLEENQGGFVQRKTKE